MEKVSISVEVDLSCIYKFSHECSLMHQQALDGLDCPLAAGWYSLPPTHILNKAWNRGEQLLGSLEHRVNLSAGLVRMERRIFFKSILKAVNLREI